MLAVLPFGISCVVRSYAWRLVPGQNGVVNQTLLDLIGEPLHIVATRAATIIGFVHFFVMLPPLTLPGIMTGIFLTFVLCIGDYITAQVFGPNM